MTRNSIREYLEAKRDSYERAGRREKGRILSEMESVTQLHRKSLLRALKRLRQPPAGRRQRGRPRIYGPQVAQAVFVAWEASGRIGMRRLQGGLRDILGALRGHEGLVLDRESGELIQQVSAPTLYRLVRGRGPRRAGRYQGAGAAPELRKQVPIRTFADWEGEPPGFLEADLVSHSGPSAGGFHLYTLTAVDIATGWVELEVLAGSRARETLGGLKAIRERLPMALLGLDTDNGTEFMNRRLIEYCQDEEIKLTRSRPYKKNDSAWVEQKNGAVVRRLTGHQRFSTKEAYVTMQRLYRLVRLHNNFFQPSMKVVEKSWKGSRQRRVYDKAQTPYRRLLASGLVSATEAEALDRLFQRLNPLDLIVRIRRYADQLQKLRDHKIRTRFGNTIYEPRWALR